MDVLSWVSKNAPSTQVVMMTAFATTETAIEAMKAGAYDYIIKPFKVDELTVLVDRALERRHLQTENRVLRATLNARAAHARLLGSSDKMQEVFELIHKVAPTRTTILLTGESGTGKELVARAIHARGNRTNEAFVAINCGAIPETLIESELFGHTRVRLSDSFCTRSASWAEGVESLSTRDMESPQTSAVGCCLWSEYRSQRTHRPRQPHP